MLRPNYVPDQFMIILKNHFVFIKNNWDRVQVETKKKLQGERYDTGTVNAVHAILTGKVTVAYRYQQQKYGMRKYFKK